ncbi:uncharacterized protein LOC132198159 isoform X2 [Neocloeon triangulifer]|uniref:uncharacterized protein LOC132198159 isoform X2 n=1 Tax=Neocloeon triangulifer TaxID=2078957 RepID=UPI00286EEFF5|nr:uncharacterized protein LOC132198159 isoform X2 [Neocloeon triangulifer]
MNLARLEAVLSSQFCLTRPTSEAIERHKFFLHSQETNKPQKMASTNSNTWKRTMPDELDNFPEEVLDPNFLKKEQFQFCKDILKFAWWQSTFRLRDFIKFDQTFISTNCFWATEDEKKMKDKAAKLLQMAQAAAEGKGVGNKSTQRICGRLKSMLEKARKHYEKKEEDMKDEMSHSEDDELGEEEEADEGGKSEEEVTDEVKDDEELEEEDDDESDVEENIEPADLSYEHDFVFVHGGPPIFLTPETEPLVELPEPDLTPRVSDVSNNQQYISNDGWFWSEENGIWVFINNRCVYSTIFNVIIALIRKGQGEWAKSIAREQSLLDFRQFLALAVQPNNNGYISRQLQYHSLRLVQICKEADEGLALVHGEATVSEVMTQFKWKAGEVVEHCDKCHIFSKTALHFITLSQLEELRVGNEPKVPACPRCNGKRTSRMRVNKLGFPVTIPLRDGDPIPLANIFQEPIMTDKVWVGGSEYQVRAAVVTYAVENVRNCVTVMPPQTSRYNNPDLWSVLDSNVPKKPQSFNNYAAESGRPNLVFFLPILP